MSVNKKIIETEATVPGPENTFKVVTWTGNGTARDISVGFKPDLVWIKSRSFARNHYWYDSTRGANKQILSNATDAEATITGRLTAFNTDSFSIGTSSEVNNNGETYVAWCWKANGGTTSSNTDGTITSTVQVNEDAGFSIVSYTGNYTAGSTVGHGLSAAPEMIIIKNLDDTDKWAVYNSSIGATKFLVLNETAAAVTSSAYWNDTAPTSTVFTIGATSPVNSPNNENYIAYCFHSVDGYSKIGSYSGNGTTQTITTGFQPDFVMIKAYTNSTSLTSWTIIDSVRYGSSSDTNPIYANLSAAEGTRGNGSGDGDVLEISFTATGFKLGDTGSDNGSDEMNDPNNDYIYMAFKIN